MNPCAHLHLNHAVLQNSPHHSFQPVVEVIDDWQVIGAGARIQNEHRGEPREHEEAEYREEDRQVGAHHPSDHQEEQVELFELRR